MKILEKIRNDFANETPDLDLDEIKAEIDDLVAKRNQLLACESAARDEINSLIRERKHKLNTKKDYKELDVSFLSFFTVKSKNSGVRFPAIVFVPVDEPEGYINFEINSSNDIFSYRDTNQPYPVREQWENVLNSQNNKKELRLKDNCNRDLHNKILAVTALASVAFWVALAFNAVLDISMLGPILLIAACIMSGVTAIASIICIANHFDGGYYHRNDVFIRLSQNLKGVIPQDIKKNLDKWKQEFTKVYFAREVSAWNELKEEIIPDPDPLVIGEDKNGRLYLLDVFDLTPVESYIASEFATGEVKKEATQVS